MSIGSSSNFKVSKVLNFDQKSKFVSILASSVNENRPAVILLEKLQFDEESLNNPSFELSFDSNNSKLINQNDIYTTLFSRDPTNQLDTKFQIIYPATEAHILKYSKQPRSIFSETPEIYHSKVLPYIQNNITKERLQWVHNILDNGKEAERVVFKDDNIESGYYLLPDTKWDCKNISSLYLLAICKRKDIYSLRDLKEEHIPLLKRMLNEIPTLVQEKYGLCGNKLRMLVHYHPSYYHFHLHVINAENDIGGGTTVGQAHLLQDIIDGIETFGSSYWQKRTITYALGENHQLYSILQ